jgi:hypothetical protein
MKRTLLFIILFLFSFIFLGFDKQKYPEHFINIMESVLLFEGGFTLIDFPEKTNMGIMQHTYNIYRTGKKLPHQSVEDITLDEVYDCYYINYYLPSSSYYEVRDAHTDEIILPFDISGSKISCDGTSSYFNLWMDSFQPERFYRIVVKTETNGRDTVQLFDNNYYFKVTR